MAHLTSLTVSFLLLVTPSVFQVKRDSTKRSNQSHRSAQLTRVYAKEPFDPSAATLPAQYRGHSIVALYLALEKTVAPKSEYETSDQYLVRLRHVLGEGLYAFRLPQEDVYLTYEADSSALQVWIVPTSITASMMTGSVLEEDSRLFSGPSVSSFIIWETPDRVAHYTASNSFGVRKRVSRTTRTGYRVVDTKYTHDIKLAISMSPSEAMQMKPKLGALVIGKIAISPLRPLVHFEYVYHISPTISEPEEYFVTYKNAVLDVGELWVFDTVSGAVLAKHKL